MKVLKHRYEALLLLLISVVFFFALSFCALLFHILHFIHFYFPIWFRWSQTKALIHEKTLGTVVFSINPNPFLFVVVEEFDGRKNCHNEKKRKKDCSLFELDFVFSSFFKSMLYCGRQMICHHSFSIKTDFYIFLPSCRTISWPKISFVW